MTNPTATRADQRHAGGTFLMVGNATLRLHWFLESFCGFLKAPDRAATYIESPSADAGRSFYPRKVLLPQRQRRAFSLLVVHAATIGGIWVGRLPSLSRAALDDEIFNGPFGTL